MVGGEGEKFNKFFAYTHWLSVIDVSFGRSFLPSEEKKKHEPVSMVMMGVGNLKLSSGSFGGVRAMTKKKSF